MGTDAIEALVATWTDQKLAEVLAFNQDGKMDANRTCCCLIGVHTSDNLHEKRCYRDHYYRAHLKNCGYDEAVGAAEFEYMVLGGNRERQLTLDAILRAEMERRVPPTQTEVAQRDTRDAEEKDCIVAYR